MFKSITLPNEFQGAWWTVSSVTGSLLKHSEKPRESFLKTPSHLEAALRMCEDPFNCGWESQPENTGTTPAVMGQLEKMHGRLMLIGNRLFMLSLLYASRSTVRFETTREAFSAISRLPIQQTRRSDLCLQRSLLAAKTSRSFHRDGVLFIGANLESVDMHAWIIESGCQPDHEDIAWINYRPLLALVA